MPLMLELPDQYGYVLAAASSTFVTNIVHSVITGKHRKASGVGYPNAYASAEEAAKNPAAFKFNCAQRAHANFIETLASFLPALFIYGLRYPLTASVLGGTWAVARILYLLGYTSDAGPKGRYRGGYFSSPIDIFVRGGAIYTSVMIALGM